MSKSSQSCGRYGSEKTRARAYLSSPRANPALGKACLERLEKASEHHLARLRENRLELFEVLPMLDVQLSAESDIACLGSRGQTAGWHRSRRDLAVDPLLVCVAGPPGNFRPMDPTQGRRDAAQARGLTQRRDRASDSRVSGPLELTSRDPQRGGPWTLQPRALCQPQDQTPARFPPEPIPAGPRCRGKPILSLSGRAISNTPCGATPTAPGRRWMIASATSRRAYLPLASAMARRMGAVMPEVSDELQSVAYLALVEAAGTFDPARSVNFATFARQHIQGAMIDFRKESRDRDPWDRRKTAGRKRRNGDPSGLARRAVNLMYEPPVGAELETLETFESWIRRLPGPHARALRHIYLDGMSQEETAVEVGCSKSRMCRMHRQGLSWLNRDRDVILND